MTEDKNTKVTKDFGYMLGRVFGTIIVGCLAAIAIATTIRLIMWIL